MSFARIRQEIENSLSVLQKLQLIADISNMLQKEKMIDSQLSEHFDKKTVYPVFTPLGMEETAAKLREYLSNGDL